MYGKSTTMMKLESNCGWRTAVELEAGEADNPQGLFQMTMKEAVNGDVCQMVNRFANGCGVVRSRSTVVVCAGEADNPQGLFQMTMKEAVNGDVCQMVNRFANGCGVVRSRSTVVVCGQWEENRGGLGLCNYSSKLHN
ncbi:hypothetical protein E3N88_33933 [Mikania micrantha]|uniref:Uncharacterized protein n=1 Tax=Mikania micrantha TaxID=192012 RepID=A0A5N6MD85_9ASTR|nr:hypothetical protein E3N88_33933 [Mikania micrantha]